MQVAVDISLYPLDADFIPPIKDVIERLSQHDGVAAARTQQKSLARLDPLVVSRVQ